ncbi:unnamed protein product [Urochloa humidicola]
MGRQLHRRRVILRVISRRPGRRWRAIGRRHRRSIVRAGLRRQLDDVVLTRLFPAAESRPVARGSRRRRRGKYRAPPWAGRTCAINWWRTPSREFNHVKVVQEDHQARVGSLRGVVTQAWVVKEVVKSVNCGIKGFVVIEHVGTHSDT